MKEINLEKRFEGVYEHINSGEYDKAVLELTEIIELQPKNALAYFLRGLAYYQLDNTDARAMDDCKSVIELDGGKCIGSYVEMIQTPETALIVDQYLAKIFDEHTKTLNAIKKYHSNLEKKWGLIGA
jgi:tetratricopeptide (TPR) repeat protein